MMNYQNIHKQTKHKSVKFERKRKTGLQIVIENIQGENKVINKVKKEIAENNVVENNVVKNNVVENNVAENNVVENKFRKPKKKNKKY